MIRKFLASLTNGDKVVLLAITLARFTYWPSIELGGASIEPAVLWSPLILMFAMNRLGVYEMVRELYNSPWKYLVGVWLYGALIALIQSSNKTTILIDCIYLLSVILGAFGVSQLLTRGEISLSKLLKGWVLIAAILSPLLFVQFILASLGLNEFIKDAYQVGVFQFPRLHGFSFEPLFLANWHLPPLLYSGYLLVSKKTSPKYLYGAAVILQVLLLLTLARGAIYAFIITCILAMALIGRMPVRRLLGVGLISLCISMLAIGWAATRNDSGFIEGIGRYLDHATLGVFNEEGATNVEPTKITVIANGSDSENSTPIVIESFTSLKGKDDQGVVEGSTLGRLESIKTGIEIITDSPSSALFGSGLFRFGEEANQLKPSVYQGSGLVANAQPVDVLVELGLIGVFGLVLFAWRARNHILGGSRIVLLIFIALCVQYFFFSSYTLLPFWLCLGLLIGSSGAVSLGGTKSLKKKSN